MRSRNVASIIASIGTVLILSACIADPNAEHLGQQNDPQGPFTFKSIELELALNMQMPDRAPLRQAVFCEEDEDYLHEYPEQELRAIEISADRDKKTIFQFAKDEERNMVVILSQKDSQGRPINTIYIDRVRYAGTGNNAFKIPRQRIKGLIQQNATDYPKPGSSGWYAMCIYDNPLRSLFSANSREVNLSAGAWSSETSSLAPIGLARGERNEQKKVQIPFFSEWTPVEITKQYIVKNKSENPIKLKMPGVLLRIMVHNKSSLPIQMERLAIETNVLHPIVTYDLSPASLPSIGEGSVLNSLVWKPGGEVVSLESFDEKRLNDFFYLGTENVVMMGKSLVAYRNYKKTTEGNPDLSYDKNIYGVPTNAELKEDIYIWGMPLREEELKRFDNNAEEIPMTAIYTQYHTMLDKDNTRYVLSDDKQFDQKLLQGYLPVPGGCAELSFVSTTKLRNAEGKPLAGVIPVHVVIENRDPCPLDFLCRSVPVLEPKDTYQVKPTLKSYEKLVHNDKDPSYFSYDYITNKQPDGSTENSRLRIRYKKDASPINGYHIPNRDEISGIISESVLVFNNPKKKNDYPTVTYTEDIDNNKKWNLEQIRIKNNTYRTWALFRRAGAEETALLTDTKPGQVRNMTVAMRGLGEGGNEGDFHYTPAMGVYLYSPGDNHFWIECIPLSRHWVKRFNCRRDKFADYVMTGKFFYLHKDKKVHREILYRDNWSGSKGNIFNPEKWGSWFWRSPSLGEKYPTGGDALPAFGFEWDKREHTGNLIYHPSYDDKQRPANTSYNGFGVVLFYDKLWEQNK